MGIFKPHPNNILELKVALQSIWYNMPQDPIDRCILCFTKRLRACIKANGEHMNVPNVILTICNLLLQDDAQVINNINRLTTLQHCFMLYMSKMAYHFLLILLTDLQIMYVSAIKFFLDSVNFIVMYSERLPRYRKITSRVAFYFGPPCTFQLQNDQCATQKIVL